MVRAWWAPRLVLLLEVEVRGERKVKLYNEGEASYLS